MSSEFYSGQIGIWVPIFILSLKFCFLTVKQMIHFSTKYLKVNKKKLKVKYKTHIQEFESLGFSFKLSNNQS